jgi:hypothetical protein
MMEEIVKKVAFSKSGTGHITPKVSIPIEWIREIGITEEDKEIVIKFVPETKEIILKKATK